MERKGSCPGSALIWEEEERGAVEEGWEWVGAEGVCVCVWRQGGCWDAANQYFPGALRTPGIIND